MPENESRTGSGTPPTTNRIRSVHLDKTTACPIRPSRAHPFGHGFATCAVARPSVVTWARTSAPHPLDEQFMHEGRIGACAIGRKLLWLLPQSETDPTTQPSPARSKAIHIKTQAGRLTRSAHDKPLRATEPDRLTTPRRSTKDPFTAIAHSGHPATGTSAAFEVSTEPGGNFRHQR